MARTRWIPRRIERFVASFMMGSGRGAYPSRCEMLLPSARRADAVAGVDHGRRGGEAGWHEERGVAEAPERARARHAAEQEAADHEAAEPQASAVHGDAAQRVAEEDAEVGVHAREVGRADDGAA